MKQTHEVRLLSLDALRGIASAIVVLFHCFQFLPSSSSSRTIHYLFPGSAAVLIFFVLSGFVLSMTFVYREGERLLPFFVKRFTRIWPPFAVAITASAGLSALISNRDVIGVTSTFFEVWSEPVSPGLIFHHLSMIGTNTSLDPPMWTLIQELRISLIFPFIVAITKWRWWIAMIFSAFIAVSVGQFQSNNLALDSFLMSFRIIFLFVLGISLAIKMKSTRIFIENANPSFRIILWIASILLLCTAPDMSSLRLDHLGDIRLIIHGVAAASIVLLCASGVRTTKYLSAPFLVYLGRISYSLYLWHQIVIVFTVYTLNKLVPAGITVFLGALISIIIADLSERYLERTSIAIGRIISRRLQKGNYNYPRGFERS